MPGVGYIKWMAPIFAALSYAAWQFFARQVYAAGLPPFDLHPYGLDEARTYLAALTPAAIATYTGPLHRADLALLISLTTSLILPVWRRGWVWTLPALAYAGFDLAENAAVAALLTTAAPTAEAVATIAVLTALKFAALGLAALLAMAALWRNRRMLA